MRTKEQPNGKGEDPSHGENAAQDLSRWEELWSGRWRKGWADEDSGPEDETAACSLRGDDAVADWVGARLDCCLLGRDPAWWREVVTEDLRYQRDKMLDKLKAAINLLDELSEAEKERPLRVQGEEMLTMSREYCQQQGWPVPSLPTADPPGFSDLTAELFDRLRDICVRCMTNAKRGRPADTESREQIAVADALHGRVEADKVLTEEYRVQFVARLGGMGLPEATATAIYEQLCAKTTKEDRAKAFLRGHGLVGERADAVLRAADQCRRLLNAKREALRKAR